MQVIDKLNRSTIFLDKTLEFISVLAILISTCFAFLGVILRYQFGISYEILSEISTYSIVYGVFLYVGPLIKYNDHIKMELLHSILGEKSNNIVNFFINLLSLIIFIILSYASINWSSSLLEMNTKSLSGEILLFIPALGIVIGMFLGIVYSILEIIKNIFIIFRK